MTIFVDVDGVLADFVGAVCAEVTHGRLVAADCTEWNVFKFLTPAEGEAAGQLLSCESFWGELPVVDGAQDGVERLRSRYDVVFATSPWWSCQRWEWARRVWLDRNFVVEPDDIIFTARKDLLRGRALIDDKHKHVLGFDGGNQRGIVFDTPHNRTYDDQGAHRMKGWADLDWLTDDG